jgi:ABC-type transport system involved in cytochrome c biogenesis permease component
VLDALVRFYFYSRDEGWCGGFLEWFFRPVREVRTRVETTTPGFWASVELLLWNSVEIAALSGKKSEKTSTFSLPPILDRELRMALRKLKPVRRRLRLAAACTAVAFLLSLLAGQSAGRDLHYLLCVAGFYVVLTAPQRIAGLFSTERQDQTLGLLFMSGLGASEVFLSKAFSAVAIVFSDLIALAPLLALPFLMGGISFGLFLATVCCLPNVLLFTLAISLLGSVLSDDEGTAIVLAAVFGVLLMGLPLGIYLAQKLLSNGNQPLDWLLLCNPVYGPWLVFNRFSVGQETAFWRNYLITFFISISCLTLAGFLLRRLWRQREERGVLYRWSQSWRTAVHGTVSWRKSLAISWLHRNPSVWLASRDRGSVTLAWSALVGIILVWLISWALWPAKWLSIGNFFITSILLNLGLRWMIHYVAAAGFGFARRDGSYELLLTTPLLPGQIVDGQVAALRCRFRHVCLVVFALELTLMLVGLCLRTWNSSSLSVYFIVWGGLLFWAWQQSWNFGRTALSMWAALNSGRPLHAVWKASGLSSWVWIWILFNLRHLLFGLASFPSGSVTELFFVSVFVIIAFSLFLRSFNETNVYRERLKAEFREIVREPIPDPRDSRFKQWNIRERFPWGWELALDQLHERLVRRERV